MPEPKQYQGVSRDGLIFAAQRNEQLRQQAEAQCRRAQHEREKVRRREQRALEDARALLHNVEVQTLQQAVHVLAQQRDTLRSHLHQDDRVDFEGLLGERNPVADMLADAEALRIAEVERTEAAWDTLENIEFHCDHALIADGDGGDMTGKQWSDTVMAIKTFIDHLRGASGRQ